MRRRGIPTMWDGRRYRSRLGARWARFFDLLHWKHEYEPFDLPGFIPDFVLTDGLRPILIDVRPLAVLGQFDQRLDELEALIFRYWKNPIICVGAVLLERQGMFDLSLGLISDPDGLSGPAEIVQCGYCGRLSLNNYTGAWESLLCTHEPNTNKWWREPVKHTLYSWREDPGHFPGVGADECAFIENLWRTAANDVLWMATR